MNTKFVKIMTSPNSCLFQRCTSGQPSLQECSAGANLTSTLKPFSSSQVKYSLIHILSVLSGQLVSKIHFSHTTDAMVRKTLDITCMERNDRVLTFSESPFFGFKTKFWLWLTRCHIILYKNSRWDVLLSCGTNNSHHWPRYVIATTIYINEQDSKIT